MNHEALLFCAEERTVRVVTQVLAELSFQVENHREPFAAVKKLTTQHFDALIVDCDDEQNATLLFKSARNSALNSGSLAVAIVEGQAGIAKAFRIGANLVLTKPINAEQAKGTLRVARGLLRKTEAKPASASAAAAAASAVRSSEPKSVAPTESRPKAPLRPQFARPETPAHLPPSTAFEVEVQAEPTPALGASEAALLESIDRQMPTPQVNFESSPLSNPRSEPEIAFGAEQQATPTASLRDFPPSIVPADGRFGPPKRSLGTAIPAVPSFGAEIDGHVALQAPAAGEAEENSDAFSSLTPAHDEPEPGRGKKNLLLIGSLVVSMAAAAVAVEWPRLKPLIFERSRAQTHSAPQAQPPVQATPPVPQPEAVPAAADNSAATTEPTPGPDAPTPPAQAAAQPAPSEAAASPKPSVSDPAVTPAAPVPSATVVASHALPASTPANPAPAPKPQTPPAPKPHEALVVKSGTKPAVSTAPPEQAPPAVPAPPSAADDAKLVALATPPRTHIPNPDAKPVKLSQAVAESLLIKRVPPVYPTLAQQLKVGGAVQVAARIGKDGSVADAKAISGDPMLSQAAVDAVRQWKYKPYSADGDPVEVLVQVTVNFKPQ